MACDPYPNRLTLRSDSIAHHYYEPLQNAFPWHDREYAAGVTRSLECLFFFYVLLVLPRYRIALLPPGNQSPTLNLIECISNRSPQHPHPRTTPTRMLSPRILKIVVQHLQESSPKKHPILHHDVELRQILHLYYCIHIIMA